MNRKEKLNYATGGSGGLSSPTLFHGGLIGTGLVALAHWGDWIPAFPADPKVIGGCVLLGMGAMFAAVIRCPFTSLIIIFAMTGNYSLILPLMGGNIIAWSIARHLQPVSLYNALLIQDGVSLRKFSGYRGARDYRKLPVQAIMTHEVFALRDDELPREALRRADAAGQAFHAYPVLDAAGAFRGLVTRNEIQHGEESQQLGDALAGRQWVVAHPEMPIHEAANHMIAGDFQQLPVVSASHPDKLLGWITLNDIARQQNAMT